MSDENLPFFDLVSNVRAMRRLKPDPVPMKLMWKVLNAGVQAPSGQNTQPWKFVLISEPSKKKWFAERYAAAIESRFPGARERKDKPKDKVHPQLRALLPDGSYARVSLPPAHLW